MYKSCKLVQSLHHLIVEIIFSSSLSADATKKLQPFQGNKHRGYDEDHWQFSIVVGISVLVPMVDSS